MCDRALIGIDNTFREVEFEFNLINSYVVCSLRLFIVEKDMLMFEVFEAVYAGIRADYEFEFS